MESIKFAIVRLLVSKDDVYDTKTISFFNTLSEAEEKISNYSSKGSWQDHEEYEIHIFRNDKDIGSIAMIKALYNIKESDNNDKYKNCTLCSKLTDIEYASQKYGSNYDNSFLPEISNKLVLIADLNPNGGERKLQLKQCNQCGTFYLYETDYEYFAFGSEDEQQLIRLNYLTAPIYSI